MWNRLHRLQLQRGSIENQVQADVCRLSLSGRCTEPHPYKSFS